jgi:hypothetical protein
MCGEHLVLPHPSPHTLPVPRPVLCTQRTLVRMTAGWLRCGAASAEQGKRGGCAVRGTAHTQQSGVTAGCVPWPFAAANPR